MDFSQLLQFMFIMPLIQSMGGGGQGAPFVDNADYASHNKVLVPVAIAIGSVGDVRSTSLSLPPGITQDRRRSGDRRAVPHPGRRRGDQQSNMAIIPLPGAMPFDQYGPPPWVPTFPPMRY